MKGEIIYKILNFLSDQVLNQVDFVNAFLRAGYGASAGKVNYEFSKVQNKRIDLLLNKQKIRNFKKYLSKLKNDGLILENSSKQISLSDKGKKKLSNFQNSFFLNQ